MRAITIIMTLLTLCAFQANATVSHSTELFTINNFTDSLPPTHRHKCPAIPSTIDIQDLDDIEYLLETIICNKKDMPNRNQFFDANCVIRIIGQDGMTQLDRVSINTYMLRIRTSDELMHVVPISIVTANEKIKELHVREYYKGRR